MKVVATSPRQLIVVMNISRIGYIPISRLTPSTGTLNWVSRTVSRMSPIPGIPGAPMDSRMMVVHMITSILPLISTPYIFAMARADTASCMQIPFMLIVAPRGMEKEYIFGDMPSFSPHAFMFSGMEALLEESENTCSIVGAYFLKKMRGFCPVNTTISMQ